jgi:hypothetical protein
MTTPHSLTENPALLAFLDQLAEYGAGSPPEPRPALVARLDGFTPLHAVPAPLATRPTRRAGVRRRGLRPVAAAFVGGAVLFGGLAGAGALPGPLQRVSAQLGSHIGLDLPEPGADGSAPSAPASTVAPRGSGSGSAPGGPGGGRATPRSSPDARASDAPPAVPGAGSTDAPLPIPLPSIPPTIPSVTTPDEPATRPAPLTRREVRRILRELSQLVPSP